MIQLQLKDTLVSQRIILSFKLIEVVIMLFTITFIMIFILS